MEQSTVDEIVTITMDTSEFESFIGTLKDVAVNGQNHQGEFPPEYAEALVESLTGDKIE